MSHEKNFDVWNIQKKKIDATNTPRFYKEREVWWANLGKNIGFEQDGKGIFFERPVLVIKAFSKSVCIILPLTTSHKINPYYLSIGIINGRQSFVIISQIRLIDTKRLINRIDVLNKVAFETIRKTVRNLF